jgi:predicted Zn-dependent protease
MQDYFSSVADVLRGLLQGEEVFTANFSGEESDFVRFNHNQVRQAGSVTQRYLNVDLIAGSRHAAGLVTLTGDLELDRPRLAGLITDLREQHRHVPNDPYLLYATDVQSTTRIAVNKLPEAADSVAEIQRAGDQRDLVGLYASGGIHAGFANSLGQRNWQTTYSFNLNWSFYRQADKAVKTEYAGFEWEPAQFGRKVAWANEQLAALGHTPTTVKPGRYRVYMSPTALTDLLAPLCWGGFGIKAVKSKQTPLLKMVESGVKLHSSLTLLENTREGVAPNFQEAGFLRPDSVTLLRNGALADMLVSPRSSREYGVPTNGASAYESPASLDVAGGKLPTDDVLQHLGTGVYIGNLWYLNYSDRNACRTTGMTRFATFWVQGGKIVGPLNVMRFDETMYRALGENLQGLTAERELLLDAGTYDARSTRSVRIPGALIEDFAFTL